MPDSEQWNYRALCPKCRAPVDRLVVKAADGRVVTDVRYNPGTLNEHVCVTGNRRG